MTSYVLSAILWSAVGFVAGVGTANLFGWCGHHLRRKN